MAEPGCRGMSTSSASSTPRSSACCGSPCEGGFGYLLGCSYFCRRLDRSDHGPNGGAPEQPKLKARCFTFLILTDPGSGRLSPSTSLPICSPSSSFGWFYGYSA